MQVHHCIILMKVKFLKRSSTIINFTTISFFKKSFFWGQERLRICPDVHIVRKYPPNVSLSNVVKWDCLGDFPTLCRPFPSNRQQKVKKGQNRDFFDMADFAWYSKNSLKIPSSPSFLSEWTDKDFFFTDS